jgi:putative addiction module killer protein
MKKVIKIETTEDFNDWLLSLTCNEKIQVTKRLIKIEEESHFGDFKYLDDDLYELRWRNGWRVYFTRISVKEILLLLGGHKNGQKKDIKKAYLVFSRYANSKN